MESEFAKLWQNTNGQTTWPTINNFTTTKAAGFHFPAIIISKAGYCETSVLSTRLVFNYCSVLWDNWYPVLFVFFYHTANKITYTVNKGRWKAIIFVWFVVKLLYCPQKRNAKFVIGSGPSTHVMYATENNFLDIMSWFTHFLYQHDRSN